MIRVLLTTTVLLIPFSAYAQDYEYCNKKHRFGSPEWWKCMQDTSWNRKLNHRRYRAGDLAIDGQATRPQTSPMHARERLAPAIYRLPVSLSGTKRFQ